MSCHNDISVEDSCQTAAATTCTQHGQYHGVSLGRAFLMLSSIPTLDLEKSTWIHLQAILQPPMDMFCLASFFALHSYRHLDPSYICCFEHAIARKFFKCKNKFDFISPGNWQHSTCCSSSSLYRLHDFRGVEGKGWGWQWISGDARVGW